jgi:multidrug efflux pump subunit AcrB
VVNNAILIVHQGLNFMHDEGWDDRHAIVEAPARGCGPF